MHLRRWLVVLATSLPCWMMPVNAKPYMPGTTSAASHQASAVAAMCEYAPGADRPDDNPRLELKGAAVGSVVQVKSRLNPALVPPGTGAELYLAVLEPVPEAQMPVMPAGAPDVRREFVLRNWAGPFRMTEGKRDIKEHLILALPSAGRTLTVAAVVQDPRSGTYRAVACLMQ